MSPGGALSETSAPEHHTVPTISSSPLKKKKIVSDYFLHTHSFAAVCSNIVYRSIHKIIIIETIKSRTSTVCYTVIYNHICIVISMIEKEKQFTLLLALVRLMARITLLGSQVMCSQCWVMTAAQSMAVATAVPTSVMTRNRALGWRQPQVSLARSVLSILTPTLELTNLLVRLIVGYYL